MKTAKSQQAQVASIIKTKLKSFGIKCTAKSNSFSMGNSVDIKVINQPPWIMAKIRKETDCYEYGTFDGMTDSSGIKNRDFDGPQTKYLHISNSFTEDVEKAAWIELCSYWTFLEGKEEENYNNLYISEHNRYASELLWCYLQGTDKNHCYFKKPRIKAVKEVKTVNSYSIEKHTHTKKQKDMYICINSERVDRDTFNSERERAKSLNGWYSRKWGNTPCGFAFNSEEEATNFVTNAEVKNNVINIDTAKIDKLKKLAEGMTVTIDDKFRDRPTHTPRMMAQYQKAKQEGHRLERAQKLLYKIAEGLENDNLAEELKTISSKKSAIAVVATKLELITNGYHSYHVCTGQPLYPDDKQVIEAFKLISGTSEEEENKQKERALQNAIAEVKNTKIDGYFPTTGQALEQLIELADLKPDLRCLEPSAGKGDIADELKKHTSYVDCIELNHTLKEILVKKGHSVSHSDFLTDKPDFTRYDRIVMNPPFEKDNAASHIEHALDFLAEGGTLVSVIPSRMMQKTTPKILSLIDKLSGFYKIFEMEANSFKSEGTAINTQIIRIRK